MGIDVPIPKSAIPVLINLIESHPTLQVLELNTINDPKTKWFKEGGLTRIMPVIDAAKNSKLVELVLLRHYKEDAIGFI